MFSGIPSCYSNVNNAHLHQLALNIDFYLQTVPMCLTIPLEPGQAPGGHCRARGDLLPEKDPLEVGCRVEGIGGHGADLVVLQVQVL